MPEREPLNGGDACVLAYVWGVHPTIMDRVVRAATQFTAETGRRVLIISGYRTAAQQRAEKEKGRPTAADELSTHRSCPATGVDVNVGYGVTNVLKATWGRIVTEQGLRWGGGSPPDPKTGIPSDWNHVDGGPRGQTGVLPQPPTPIRSNTLTTSGQPLVPAGCPPGHTRFEEPLARALGYPVRYRHPGGFYCIPPR